MAAWESIGSLAVGAAQAWEGERLFRCDPYLVWADAVTSAEAATELQIGVLVEVRPGLSFKEFWGLLNPDPQRLQFMPNGFEAVPPASRFVTGVVNRTGLDRLVALVLSGGIERFLVQNSRDDIAKAIDFACKSLPPLEGLPDPVTEVAGSAEPDPGTYLGIIDDGLPVLRVRDSIRTAGPPAHLWDQGWQPAHLVAAGKKPGEPPADDDPHWESSWAVRESEGQFREPPRGFLYGRRLRKLAGANAMRRRNDRDEYASSGYFTPSPRQTHGAGVLGLLAPWLSGAKKEVEWPQHVSGLAMVQLPTRTVLDTSGGSLAMRALDGLRYILWQEENDRHRKDLQRPVVVNVSYGTQAGPHDGTSMFERAVAEMLDHHPRLHLVLPAGNAAQTGCHAHRDIQPGGTATMFLQVLPDNPRDTFVELWLPKDAEVELSLRPPGRAEAFPIRAGQAKIHFEPDPADPQAPETIHFGAVYAKEVAQGTEGGMALVAIGATRRVHRPDGVRPRGLNHQPRREVHGSAGLWELTLRNLGASAVAVDAWIERDDAPPNAQRGSRQAFFPDSCCGAVRLGNATPEGTLNGIATLAHARLHVVGAMRDDEVLSRYSSAGPARAPGTRDGPDVVVPADKNRNLPGVATLGFLQGASTRINGTSAACAVYARALAEGLARDPPQPPASARPLLDPPPGIEAGGSPECQPEAAATLRGQDKRCVLAFDIEL